MGRGSVVQSTDFLDLGKRESVQRALARHAAKGRLRKVGRGIYELPVRSIAPKTQPVSAEAVAKTLARQQNIRIQPSGAHAANLLGLTTQVPVRLAFLTDGPSRTISVGNRRLVFKRASPRLMATAGRTSGTVISALRWLGQRNVDEGVVDILRRRLRPDQKRRLLRDLRYAPTWIAGVMRRIAGEDR
jgi:hypothetical protein